MHRRSAREALAVDAIRKVSAVAAPVAEIEEALLFVSAARRYQHPLGQSGVLGDDVDHTVHRIRPPDRAARPPNDFDPVDVVHQRILNFPVRAVEQRREYRAPVDQHQHRTRQPASEPANSNRPLVGVDSRHLHARRQPQRLRYAGRPRSPDVLAGDHVDRGSGLKGLHRLFGGCRDFDLREFFQAQALEHRRGDRESVLSPPPAAEGRPLLARTKAKYSTQHSKQTELHRNARCRDSNCRARILPL